MKKVGVFLLLESRGFSYFESKVIPKNWTIWVKLLIFILSIENVAKKLVAGCNEQTFIAHTSWLYYKIPNYVSETIQFHLIWNMYE